MSNSYQVQTNNVSESGVQKPWRASELLQGITKSTHQKIRNTSYRDQTSNPNIAALIIMQLMEALYSLVSYLAIYCLVLSPPFFCLTFNYVLVGHQWYPLLPTCLVLAYWWTWHPDQNQEHTTVKIIAFKQVYGYTYTGIPQSNENQLPWWKKYYSIHVLSLSES